MFSFWIRRLPCASSVSLGMAADDYGFEFSIDGVERYRGHAVLLGRVLEVVQMQHPDGAVIQGPGADRVNRGEGGAK